MIIKKVCAWCGRSMGSIECNNQNSSPSETSHGMCDECLQLVMAELEEAVNEYIRKQNKPTQAKESKDE